MRYILFCVFFAVGILAVVLSIYVDELSEYYKNKDLLKTIDSDNEKIKNLTSQYEFQIEQIESDPNILLRLGRITLGTEPKAEETAFPRASDQILAAAAQAILQETQRPETQNAIPQWLRRSSEPKFRQSLFFAGAGLILITFIFFGTKIKKQPKAE